MVHHLAWQSNKRNFSAVSNSFCHICHAFTIPMCTNETNDNMTVCGIAYYNRKLEIITQLGYTMPLFLFLRNLSSHFWFLSQYRLGECERVGGDAATIATAFQMATSFKSHIHFVIRLILMMMIRLRFTSKRLQACQSVLLFLFNSLSSCEH